MTVGQQLSMLFDLMSDLNYRLMFLYLHLTVKSLLCYYSGFTIDTFKVVCNVKHPRRLNSKKLLNSDSIGE